MYAVIKTGGKQQRVQAGDVIEVEHIVAEGETVSFRPLLVVDDDGATHVGKEAASATVTATPLGDKKGDKVRVLRYRPKTGYAKRTGHRQLLTLLEIQGIQLGARKTPSKTPKTSAKTPAKTTAKTTTKTTKAATPDEPGDAESTEGD